MKPDNAEAFYSKACSYALKGNVEQAIKNLQQAINLSPNIYLERVGDYRLIYRIEEARLVIVIVKVGHRKNIYKSLVFFKKLLTMTLSEIPYQFFCAD